MTDWAVMEILNAAGYISELEVRRNEDGKYYVIDGYKYSSGYYLKDRLSDIAVIIVGPAYKLYTFEWQYREGISISLTCEDDLKDLSL